MLIQQIQVSDGLACCRGVEGFACLRACEMKMRASSSALHPLNRSHPQRDRTHLYEMQSTLRVQIDGEKGDLGPELDGEVGEGGDGHCTRVRVRKELMIVML